MVEYLGHEMITVCLEDGRQEQERLRDHLSRWHHYVAENRFQAESYEAMHDLMHFEDEEHKKEQDHTHPRLESGGDLRRPDPGQSLGT